MKHILMIGTGGTIASDRSENGLVPVLTSEQLLRYVPGIRKFCSIDCIQPFSLDSTNMQPRHWQQISEVLQAHYDRYDGFVIAHGTDTMAYTAAALTYLVQGSKKPIVLTGSQKPIGFDSTDSKVNLEDAFRCACCDSLHGVLLVFNGKIMLGSRACKTHSQSYEAFSSINYPYVGIVQGGKILQYIEPCYSDLPVFYPAPDPKVALLKLIPGTDPELLRWMLQHNDGLVLESFGVGGIPEYPDSAFLEALEEGIAAKKAIVLTTQVQYEGSSLGTYQVGRCLTVHPEILEAGNMTTSAVCAKLMCILGRTKDPDEVRRLFYLPVACDFLRAAE